MFRCPKCNEVIFEDSAICPHCGFVVTEGAVSGLDEELERISQMVFNIENDLGAIGEYKPAIDPTKPPEKEEEEVKQVDRPYNDKGFLDEQEGYGEEEVIEEPPTVFTASKSGVVQVVEDTEIKSILQEEDDESVSVQDEENEEDKYGTSISDSVLKEIEELQNAEMLLKEDLGDLALDDDALNQNFDELADEINKLAEEIEEDKNQIQEEIKEIKEDTDEIENEINEKIEEKTDEIEEETSEEIEDIQDEVEDETSEEIEDIQDEVEEEINEEIEDTQDEVEEETSEEIEDTQDEVEEEINEETEDIQDEIQEEPEEEQEVTNETRENDFFDSIEEPEEVVYDEELEKLMESEHQKFFSDIDILEPFSNEDPEEFISESSSTIDFFDFDKINDTFNSSEEIYTKEELDYFKFPPNDEVAPVYDVYEANQTYITLNFISIEKFATLISSENEKLDLEVSVNSTYDNKYIDLYDIDAIIHSETLSDEELDSTMKAVLNQKVEMKQSLERAEKDKKINSYKEVRHRLMNGVRAVGVFVIIMFCVYLYSYNIGSDDLDLKSELYQKSTIEEYDRVLYSSSQTIISGEKILEDLFEQYENNEITEEDFKQICLEYKSKLTSYEELYNKHVYEEANDYLFATNNIYFFASYYLDNLILYLDTDDEYYLKLNRDVKAQNSALIEEEMQNRKKFLKSVGFTDEEIEILNMKLSEGKKE